MPLYEYHCLSCGTEFEALVRAGERVACEKCGAEQLEKLFSRVSARVSSGSSLPVAPGCPPADAPPCSPTCCRLP